LNAKLSLKQAKSKEEEDQYVFGPLLELLLKGDVNRILW